MLHGYLRHHKHTPRRRLRAAGGGSSPPRRGGEQPGGTPGPCFTPTPPPQPRTHTHPPLNFSSRNPPALPWHKRWEGEVTSHTFLLGGKLKCFHFCAPPPFFFSLSFKYLKKRTKANRQRLLFPLPVPQNQPSRGRRDPAGRGGGRGLSPPRGPGAGARLSRGASPPPAPAPGNPPPREPERTQRGLFK